MSKRLASFGGPSSPSPSPVKALNSSPHRQPSSGNQSQHPHHGRSQRLQNQSEIYESNETTYHRKLRSALLEIKGITKTWNDLVLHDGLKAAKALVDTRTELSCVSTSNVTYFLFRLSPYPQKCTRCLSSRSLSKNTHCDAQTGDDGGEAEGSR